MVERKNNKQKNRTKYFLPGGKKQIQAVCAFLFLGVLILSCGVNLMHKDRQMSEKEMRMLAQKPEISLSGIALWSSTRSMYRISLQEEIPG